MTAAWKKDEAGRALHHGGNAVGGLIIAAAAIAGSVQLIAPHMIPALWLVYRWCGAALLAIIAVAAICFTVAAIRNWMLSPEELQRRAEDGP